MADLLNSNSEVPAPASPGRALRLLYPIGGESVGRLLGQRSDRELLQQPEAKARAASARPLTLRYYSTRSATDAVPGFTRLFSRCDAAVRCSNPQPPGSVSPAGRRPAAIFLQHGRQRPGGVYGQESYRGGDGGGLGRPGRRRSRSSSSGSSRTSSTRNASCGARCESR